MPRDRSDQSDIPSAVREAVSGAADICITGEISDASVADFVDKLQKAREKRGDIVLCCTTPGGDANMTRRIVLELELLRNKHPGQVYFLGKSLVYSAGVSIMAAFPTTHRFLTSDTILLIHGRQLTKTLELDGPIRSMRAKLEALLHEIDVGLTLEEEGFRRLVEGSSLSPDDALKRSLHNWYLTAGEAKDLGLIAGVV